ncbi:MAG: AAA family ATPase [Candidatus Omnitrophica bacterium]|nr:AAA family ATPase [Candidatus Omnitrophota bacterium]
MSYYNILGLEKEPFSTSPDPEFFYHSAGHDSALKRLEIAIRLRRGLNIILGDIGTGKTTLSRTLLQAFEDDNDYIFHMILDPGFKSEFQFLLTLVKMFNIVPQFKSTLDFKEALEKYLFQKGVEENKTIVLLIDEGQKISPENLEVLRTLLNYETNEYKLLQLVIMGQVELLPKIKRIRNFMDRVALKYTINPLDEEETKELVHFRLKQAGYTHLDNLFSDDAIKLIHKQTQGYPRRIAMLCHDALETIVMKERLTVDADTIQELIRQGREYEG